MMTKKRQHMKCQNLNAFEVVSATEIVIVSHGIKRGSGDGDDRA